MTKQMILIPYADYESLVSFASNMHDERYNLDPRYRPRAKELHDKHYPSALGGEASPYKVYECEQMIREQKK